MNLDEFKAHVQSQRNASLAGAMSVLSAKITNETDKKEK